MTTQTRKFSVLTAALVACGLSFSAGADQLPNEGESHTLMQQPQTLAINIAGPASAAYAREAVAGERHSVTEDADSSWAKFVRDLERNNSGNYAD